MSHLIVRYGDKRQLSAYHAQQLRTDRLILTAETRKATAFLILELPVPIQLDYGEEFIITKLFQELGTRKPWACTLDYAYCQHLWLDALPVVIRGIEAMLETKEQAQR